MILFYLSLLFSSCSIGFTQSNSGVTSCNPDVAPPTCIPVDDIVQEIPRGFGGDSVSWTEPSAEDNCGPAELVDRSNSPGQFFDTGFKYVTYTYNDTSDNQAICRFSVCVTEGEPNTCQPPVPTTPNSGNSHLSQDSTTPSGSCSHHVISAYCLLLIGTLTFTFNWLK